LKKLVLILIIFLNIVIINTLNAQKLPLSEYQLIIKQGESFYNRGDFKQAINYYKKALFLAQRNGLIEEEINILIRIGNIYWYTRNYSKSIDSYLQALNLAREKRKGQHEVICLRNIGLTYWKLNDIQKAIYYYQKAFEVAREIGDKKRQARCLNNLAFIFRSRGEYIKALDCLEEALDIFRSLNNDYGTLKCLNSLGVLYWYLGYYTKAVDYYKQALNLARKLQERKEEGKILNNLGIIHRHLNDYKQAFHYYKLALKIAKEHTNKREVGRYKNNIGNLYFDKGDYNKALSYYRESYELSKEVNDQINLVNLTCNLGLTYAQLHDYPKAIEYSKMALALSKETGQFNVMWEAYFDLAQAYEKQDNFELALKNYEKAIEVVESLRSRIQISDYKAGFLRDKIEAYHGMINLLFKLYKLNPSFEYIKKAFNFAERAKARAFLDSLAESQVEIGKGIDPLLRKQEKEITRAISRIYTQLVNSNPTKEERKRMLAELDNLENELEEIKRKIIQKSPAYASLKYPEPIILEETQTKLLDEKSVFLEYSLGKENSYLFVVTKNDIKMYALPSQKKIEKKVYNYLQFISQPSPQKEKIKKGYNAGYQLFKTLILPAFQEINNKEKLYVIPDGILYYLPFETLIMKNKGKKVKFLIEKYEIAYAPSTSVLREIISRGREEEKNKRSLIAFGDPVFGKAEITGDKTQFIIRRGLYSEAGFKFNRLKFSGIEVNKISALFPKEKKDIFLRERAKEEIVKFRDLRKYKIIHFATHGFIDDIRPSRSAVILTLDNDPKEDGFLQMREIFNLDLNADLVTLSACQTGLGKLIKGEGIVGLNRAFFYAGASSVLMSLWTVNDHAGAQFMERFYYHLKNAKPKAKALRKVKLEMIRSKTSLSHPYYWAGFILSGESESKIINSSFFNIFYYILQISLLSIAFLFVFLFFKKKLNYSKNSSS
jgi:CHAT domain-containing protein/tetratricopeptide (TPR) repeat protein